MDKNFLLEQFVNLYKQIDDMGTNFSRDKLSEYTSLYERLNKCAVEIIRMNACPKQLIESEYLVLYINGASYKILFEDIISLLTEEEVKSIVSNEKANDKQSAISSCFNNQTNVWESLINCVNTFTNSLNSRVSVAEQKNTTLLEDINMIQRKIILLEEENRRLANIKEDNDKSKEEKETLLAKIEAIEKEKSEAVKKMDSFAKQVDDYEREKSELEEAWASTVEENERYKKQLEKADGMKNELNIKIEDLEKQIAEKEQCQPADNEETNGLVEANNKLSEELNLAKEEIEKLRNNQVDQEIVSENEKLKGLVEKYKALAYTDGKYNVMNANAYHDFIENCEDKDNITVCVCGISNTKQINQLYGKHRGDNIIKIVANELSALYGKENVYRVYGDQFFVFVNKGASAVKDEMAKLSSELFEDKISVSYGVVDAVTCDSMNAAIKQVEGDMNSMKIKNGRKEIISNELSVGSRENIEQQSEEVLRYAEDDIDVLSKTTVQKLGEPEVLTENLNNQSSDEDEFFSMFC